MKLLGSIVAVGDLKSVERDRMFALMDGIYANMCRGSFESDLDAKQWVIRLEEPKAKRLVGFSTQTMIDVQVGGESINALFSGDTVVDRDHWGDTSLASTWGNFALQIIDEYHDSDLYWFLISKGFRTYRYLPLFFQKYYPHSDRLMPEKTKHILNELGRHVAPQRYDVNSQIIRADHTKEYVRPEYASATARISPDPHVRFFVDSNPHYQRGDELCCLAPLTRENFTRLAWRMIRSQPAVTCAS